MMMYHSVLPDKEYRHQEKANNAWEIAKLLGKDVPRRCHRDRSRSRRVVRRADCASQIFPECRECSMARLPQ